MYGNITIEVDVFERKNSILRHYTDSELKNELKRREERKIINEEEVINLDLDFEISTRYYKNDFFNNIPTIELLKEIKRYGYDYIEEEEMIFQKGVTQKSLAKWLGLKEWATKEQIMKELEYIF